MSYDVLKYEVFFVFDFYNIFQRHAFKPFMK
jgi:hypothetical protein